MDKKLFFVLIGILIANLVFISSQEEISLLEGKIIGNGIEYQQTQDEGIKLTFVDEGASVSVNGDKFENIVSQGKAKHPTEIELDKGGKIIKADFSVNEKGGTYVFGNTQIYAPPNSRVFFDKQNGIRMKVEDGAELIETPKAKNLNLPSEYLTTIESPVDGSFKLPNGVVVSGRLGFENGQAFIDAFGKTEINNVELLFEKSKSNIFFDGKRHEDKYVSFGEDKLIISANQEESPIINFKENNPYLRIDEGDHVAMRALQGSEIEIQNRDEQGLIPQVTTKGNFVIDEDYKSLDASEGEILIWRRPKLINVAEGATTSPAAFFFLNKDGSYRSPAFKIYVDNFNRMFVEKFLGRTQHEAFPEGVDTKFSEKIHYNYPVEGSIRALTGKEIIFNDVSQGNKDLVLGRLRDYWETLTPETRDSIKSIKFENDESFERNYPGTGEDKPDTIQAYYVENGPIVFRSNERFNLDAFRHEAAHQHLFQVDPSFSNEWSKIAGNVYDTNLVRQDSDGEWYYTFDKDYSYGPLYGLAIPYGGKSISEDVTTFVQYVNNPLFFQRLKSIGGCDSYTIYGQKFALLHEYNLISDKEYKNVLSECAGLK